MPRNKFHATYSRKTNVITTRLNNKTDQIPCLSGLIGKSDHTIEKMMKDLVKTATNGKLHHPRVRIVG